MAKRPFKKVELIGIMLRSHDIYDSLSRVGRIYIKQCANKKVKHKKPPHGQKVFEKLFNIVLSILFGGKPAKFWG